MRHLVTLAALALAAYTPFAAAHVPKGVYEIDKSHASVLFRVDHAGFSAYTGRFTRFDATLDFDPARIASSRVNVTIDPRSIEADNVPSGFLDSLTGADWLDTGKFPAMSFRSKTIEHTGADIFRIHGDLTLHGVTKPIALEARFNGGYASHPLEPRARIGFSAPGTRMGVGDEVQVILETEFTGPPAAVTNSTQLDQVQAR